jgi:hypothetical protein
MSYVVIQAGAGIGFLCFVLCFCLHTYSASEDNKRDLNQIKSNHRGPQHMRPLRPQHRKTWGAAQGVSVYQIGWSASVTLGKGYSELGWTERN